MCNDVHQDQQLHRIKAICLGYENHCKIFLSSRKVLFLTEFMSAMSLCHLDFEEHFEFTKVRSTRANPLTAP